MILGWLAVQICGCTRRVERFIWLVRTLGVEPSGFQGISSCSSIHTVLKAKRTSLNHWNVSGRSLTDRIAVLNTRGPGPIKNRLTWLQTRNFEGISQDGTFNLHGFDVRVDSKDKDLLHLLLVNDRPFMDVGKGGPFNRTHTESNSTIEYFTTILGSKMMIHKQTFANENIVTPRHVSWVDEHLFMFTNAHNSRSTSVSYELANTLYTLIIHP